MTTPDGGTGRADTAMVFPGMGPGTFDDVAEFMTTSPFVPPLLAVADDVLGYHLLDRFKESGSPYTEPAQLAFLVNCLALAEWARDELGIEPAVCTGPSFGAKTVTAYVGALSLSDALRMTALLAGCAREYFARAHRDVVTHSFVRAPMDKLRDVLADLDRRGEWHDFSCHIDHDFAMLSLRERNLEWLQRRLRGIGALPLYTMRPPMHSRAFGELRNMAEQALREFDFATPRQPVIADQDGQVITTGAGIRTMLLDGFVRPVRWPSVVDRMRRLGVRRVCVSGPDSLFSRVRCTTENFEVLAVNQHTPARTMRQSGVRSATPAGTLSPPR